GGARRPLRGSGRRARRLAHPRFAALRHQRARPAHVLRHQPLAGGGGSGGERPARPARGAGGPDGGPQGGVTMDTFIKDLRFAIRGLRRTPGFTVAAVVALALGIGATTAIFSVVHAVLLQSLGFGDEQRLVWVTAEQRGYGWKHGGLSPPEVVTDLRAFPLFEASGGVTRQTASLLTDRAERVEILAVTSGFFEALGVQPLFGRTFTHAEDMKGNDGVVLISASAWRRRLGAD